MCRTNTKYAAIIRKQEESISDYQHLVYLLKTEITSLKSQVETKENEFTKIKKELKKGICQSEALLGQLTQILSNLSILFDDNECKIIEKTPKNSFKKTRKFKGPPEMIYMIPEIPEIPEISEISEIPSPPDSFFESSSQENTRTRKGKTITYTLPSLRSKLRRGNFYIYNLKEIILRAKYLGLL